MKIRKPLCPGDKFGHLTAIEETHAAMYGRTKWKWLCDCGNAKEITARDVRYGNTISCGCKASRKTIGERSKTHGMRRTLIYGVWSCMHRRCYNKNTKDYPNYGGRGIIVCERWHKFENFFLDMGEAPPDMSLDRISTTGNYEPNNCRWASRMKQSANRRNVHKLTYQGKTLTLVEWSKVIGISSQCIYQRFRKGLPVERVLKPE